MARLDPLADGTIKKETLDLVRTGERLPLNRARTIGRLRGLNQVLGASEALLAEECTLEPIVTATIIATATRRSAYESERLHGAFDVDGLTEDMLEAIADEDWTEPSFSTRQKIAMQFTMMCDAGHGVTDAIFGQLQEQFSDDEIVQIVALCSHFGGLARMAIALSFDIEE